MEGVGPYDQQAAYSVNIPLLVDDHEKLRNVGETKSSSGDTSFFKTCFNGLNALSGVGILAVPYALSSGGSLSLVLLFIIAISTFYTGLLIKRCMDMDSSIRTYPDIGERAFGTIGRTCVSVMMHLELYLVATGFLILEGDNLHNIMPGMKFEIGSLVIGGEQSFVIIVALIILPTVWLDNMSVISYVSATGVIACLLLLVSILWAGMFDGIKFQERGPLINWKGIPTAVSLYSFCYCAHPVFPTLYTSMRNQSQFSKVLLICFFLCTFSYASMAVLGYLMFGSNVSSQITLNLPTDKISSKVAIYTTLVNPIAKYALMVTPIINSIENRFISHSKKRPFSLVIRTSLVISTVIVAVAVPFFGYLMSLVGAFLSISASIILPCLCFMKISGIYQRLGAELVIVSVIMLMGICILIVGTYVSLLEIIRHL